MSSEKPDKRKFPFVRTVVYCQLLSAILATALTICNDHGHLSGRESDFIGCQILAWTALPVLLCFITSPWIIFVALYLERDQLEFHQGAGALAVVWVLEFVQLLGLSTAC